MLIDLYSRYLLIIINYLQTFDNFTKADHIDQSTYARG